MIKYNTFSLIFIGKEYSNIVVQIMHVSIRVYSSSIEVLYIKK